MFSMGTQRLEGGVRSSMWSVCVLGDWEEVHMQGGEGRG